jgi:hypothetical protein
VVGELIVGSTVGDPVVAVGAVGKEEARLNDGCCVDGRPDGRLVG